MVTAQRGRASRWRAQAERARGTTQSAVPSHWYQQGTT